MAFVQKKSDSFNKKTSQNRKHEIYNFQCLAGLGDLLLKQQLKEPQIVLATLGELKELKAFLAFKSVPCFDLPDLKDPPLRTRENLLIRKAFHLGASRGIKGVFCATPLHLLRKILFHAPVILKKGTQLPDLKELGFQEKEFAMKPGEFASRGYLCDIFPPSYELPIRLELEGQNIVSLHVLNKNFKSRKEEIKKVVLMNLKEWDLKKRQSLCRFLKDKGPQGESLKTLARGEVPSGWEDLMNALSKSCSLDFFQSAQVWIKAPDKLEALFYEASLLKVQTLSSSLSREDIFLPWNTLKKFPCVYLYSHSVKDEKESKDFQKPVVAFRYSEAINKKNDIQNRLPSSYPCYGFHPKDIKEDLKKLFVTQIVFISRTSKEEEQLKKQLHLLKTDGKENSFLKDKTFLFLQGNTSSFVNETEDTAYIQTHDLISFNKRVEAKQKSSFDFFWQKARALDFSRLEKGELVVHRKHGVGQFMGLQSFSFRGIAQDYLVLNYKDQDKLLLPAYRAMEIKKYAQGGIFFQETLLDKLGDPRKWEKKKEKAKKHIQAVALELLILYRARKNLIRPAFDPVLDSLKEFAQTFPFQETHGQKKALSEIFQDMDRKNPMERLLCADVGFGKTEVALRAAFRAMENGFQVCFLVPTTILSLQHYENFKKRLKDWPFEIAVLNRFLTSKNKKGLLKKIKEGTVDLVIATHSIFSPEVSFKNLGLFIIDEEHRFGVRQKEHLRRLKKNLDTLSLSATPIPRTLYMALSSMKDISVIAEPPAQRKATEIITTQWNPALIKKACEKEKTRGGQIFFVHNKIQTIYEKEIELKQILPDFKIAVAHGRMNSIELERVMLSFFAKKFDLLLSTNIIESGMDILGANTLFIDRAHEMGLSRIYQLKGRVGRGDRQAYCYFLVPSKISSTAKERLELMRKYSHLGAGFHLAIHDLESRGAGELFGAEQSGHLNNLGQELFFELLREKLEEREEDLEPEIQLPVSTGIPNFYIPDKPLRLLYYKSLSEAKNIKELKSLHWEMEKAQGTFPPEVNHLFELLEIRLQCRTLLIKRLKVTEKSLYLTFHENTKVPREKIISGIEKGSWKMKGEFSLVASLEGQRDSFSQIRAVLLGFF